MNWLAKINLVVVVKRLGAFKSALLLFSTIGLCLFVGYRLGNYFEVMQRQTIEQQKVRLDNLYAMQNEQLKRIHTLEVEIEVERLANQKAQKTIKEMEVEHYEVEKALAFYEKVMAPEKQANGLVVEEVAIQATESANHYRFFVTLIQQETKRRFTQGHISFSIIGSKNNKPMTVKLSDISELTKKELAFKLKYFQRLEGEFTLPEDFVPERLVLEAVQVKNRKQKFNEINQEYAWRDILPSASS
ncbi:DUF6776 family protein [Thalassotalea euphylliae]|uniref:DUF6776 family protein n=1 Tax=Thalassotalea euphylliae TaxID=1655234 RepID=UPI0036415371